MVEQRKMRKLSYRIAYWLYKKKKKKRQGRDVYLFKIYPIYSDKPIK